jgi:uncharacterized protein YegL
MKKNLTEIVFVLDRSGSMYDLTKDTVDGFNSFIKKQKGEVGEAFLTTVLFDNEYEILHDRVDVKDVKPLGDEYYARGTTALLDAIGKTINIVGNKLALLDESDRPSQVLFVITTDGHENSSHEFKVDTIKSMITHQTEKYNWNFVFLGANMNAVDVASGYGIAMAATYTANSTGTRSVFNTVGGLSSSLRSTASISKDWDKDVE